ncbi:MAG TPA: hypothetical protein VGN12_21935 [Pirellulales bacterium]|jgi:hypothetical protein
MDIRNWRVRTTLLWAVIALIFALWEFTIPALDDSDDSPEHSLNRPRIATRLRTGDTLRR